MFHTTKNGENFRCGQCGHQWSSQTKRKTCIKCGSSVVQTLTTGTERVTRSDRQTRLSKLIEELNGGNSELRSYAESWLRSGCNGLIWAKNNPEKLKAIQHTLHGASLLLVPAVDGCILTWDYRHEPKHESDATRRQSDKMFADFLNESATQLGQCADYSYCGNFFEKSDPRKIYCSSQCASRVSSRKPKLDAYHATHHTKFQVVLDVLEKLSKDYTSKDLLENDYWKEKIVEESAKHAKEVRQKKTAKKLSPEDRRYQSQISIRWINRHIDKPGDCSECMAYRKKIQKLLSIK